MYLVENTQHQAHTFDIDTLFHCCYTFQLNIYDFSIYLFSSLCFSVLLSVMNSIKSSNVDGYRILVYVKQKKTCF